MTINEILILIQAGYTKDEISALVAAEQSRNDSGQPTPEQTPVSPSADGEESKPTPDQEKPNSEPGKHEPTETEKLLSALGMKLDQMTTALQASNVRHLQQPDTGLTAEKVLAQIINPHAT